MFSSFSNLLEQLLEKKNFFFLEMFNISTA